MKRFLAMVGLLIAAPAYGQLQASAGASSMFAADGASLTWTTPSTQTDIGAGVVANRFVYGGDWRVKAGPCVIALGDFAEYLGVEGAGISVANRGVSASCSRDKKRTIKLFAGDVGDLHAVPFFTATASTGQFGGGVSIQQIINDKLELDAVASSAGHQRAFLEGLRYHWQDFRAAESAGLALGHPWFQGEASYTTPHVAASIQHDDFVGLTSYTSEGFSAGAGGESVFASAFQSPASRGEAIGGVLSHGVASVNAYELFSAGQRQTIAIVTEHPLHFVLTQFIGRARGTTSLNFGGGYNGNVLAASFGYQEVFNPLAGFQKAATINLGVQMPRLTLHLLLDILPGGISYSGWGTAYVRGPALQNGQASAMAE